ncbi:ABC transporter [Streptomyces cavernae]|uniref:ABC transporter n=1 Tax=Streptomyces cavernae TaxID=2259034 RepID=UPI001EE47587|nr:ABC transporter [Streptomyces cavernae]
MRAVAVPGPDLKEPTRVRTYPVVRALLRPVAHMLPHRALAAGSVLGLLLAAVPRLYERPDAELGVGLLRAAALAFALGAAFLLDDPARHITAAVPTGRAVRVGLRMALVAPLAVLWWTAALLLVPEAARPPVGAMTLEAAATLALALAAATAAVRFSGQSEPGLGAAGGLLAAAVAATLLPVPLGLLVPVADPGWDSAHQRWAAVLAGAVLVCAYCMREAVRPNASRAALTSPSGTSGPPRR